MDAAFTFCGNAVMKSPGLEVASVSARLFAAVRLSFELYQLNIIQSKIIVETHIYSRYIIKRHLKHITSVSVSPFFCQGHKASESGTQIGINIRLSRRIG